MAYIRKWRRYHTEVNLIAQPSDDEDVSNNRHQMFTQNRHPTPENVSDAESNFSDHSNENNPEFESENDVRNRTSTSSSFSSESECHSDADNVPDVVGDLSKWATQSGCSRSSLNDLLTVLRKHGLRVPRDSRTLLQTPRSVNTLQKCGGDYLYLGIESGILKVVSTHPEQFSDANEISLTFNVDGVPLFKSTNVQMWPILCSIKKFEPFVVALFCGNSKPSSVHDYLSDFLVELNNLVQNGISVGDDVLTVSVGSFICDAPARAFLKCTKGHNAYYACERCTIKGRWNGRVVFSLNDERNTPLRSEASFNNFEYKDHQIDISPLINAGIGISCMKSFPLDYMHLVCLGVVKRMLSFLKSGPRQCRLSGQQLDILSGKLSALNGKMPREFARQPRSLYYLDRWKATELRQFLLYTGPLVLRSVVSNQVYNHFLTLRVAMSILLESDEDFRHDHISYARELLKYFVKTSEMVYGDTFVSYNIHSLIHIADDVEHYGVSLNELSAFQFENHLQKLKKSVRKAQNPIAQVTKRIVEMEKMNCRQLPKRIHISVSTQKKDSCFLLKSREIVFVKEKRDDKKYVCDVLKRSNLESFYDSPCNSKLLNTVVVKKRNMHLKRKLLEHTDFEKKLICLPWDRGYLLIPMLHGMERW